MKEQLISAVTGLFFILIGALLIWKWPNDVRPLDSAFLGCFAYLITTVALIAWKTRKLDSYQKLEDNVTYISNVSRVQEATIRMGAGSSDFFWVLCLLRAREGIYSLLDSSSIRVDRDQIPKFWQQAIINTDSSWLCTNFVNLEQDWRTGWEDTGLTLQSIGIQQSNISVRRVFIYSTRNEISAEFVDIMKRHEQLGIQVKWTTLDADYHHWAPFQKFEQEIGSIDMALIDSRYLLSFDLNNNRRIISIRCYSDDNIIATISNLYMRLWEESRGLDDLQPHIDPSHPPTNTGA